MARVDKITKTFCDNVPFATDKAVIYWDQSLRGFGLKVGKISKTFVTQKDIKGKICFDTIGPYGVFTPEEAKIIGREQLYWKSLGIDPKKKDAQDKKNTITPAEALENYLSVRKGLSTTTIKGYRYNLNKYLGDWANRPIISIDRDMIVARHSMLGDCHGAQVANNVMRVLRLTINHANKAYELDIKNPVHYLNDIKAWFPDKRRINFVKPHELPAWWASVQNLENDTIRDFLILLLFTGLRKGEAERLRWSDVDFSDKTITVTQTKNGDTLTLPMSNYLFGLFQRRFEQYGEGEFVFPATGAKGHLSEPKKGIYRIICETGIQFSCHDLRRTFLTLAESMNISAYALKRLINHRIATDITASYVVFNHERLREPVEQIAQHILELVDEKQGTTNTGFSKGRLSSSFVSGTYC